MSERLDPEALEKAAEAMFLHWAAPDWGAEEAARMWSAGDRREHWAAYARDAITAYLTSLASRGVRMMPKNAEPFAVDAGAAQIIGMGQHSDAYQCWRAMWDAQVEPPFVIAGALQCGACKREQEFVSNGDERIHGWVFTSETGWRCPEHADAQASTQELQQARSNEDLTHPGKEGER
jgi:hypothetical protein